ncbi:60S ribosomal protein L39-like isoform X2 [Trachypithecus francoisi]|uniref:60S ribosomal protein L39-like isoform X2 n=1 Tax=Trachypithecus francoisi TaxID=54180 RepID=UPI00141A73B4|nr:60S ribosomal protein L39-like isoform X2 [Trachypithecus francoisi]
MGDPKANLVTSHAGVGPTAPGPQLRGAGPPGPGRGQGGACHQGNRPPSIRARRLSCAQRGNCLRSPVRGGASRRLRDTKAPATRWLPLGGVRTTDRLRVGPAFSARAPRPCRSAFASESGKKAVSKAPILFGEKQASLPLWSRKFRLEKGAVLWIKWKS